VDENYAYEENLKSGLSRGQIIAIGTDGIWESYNREGRMFGKQRFREIVRESAHRPANEIIDAVYNDLKNFALGFKQADDITLVVIKLNEIPGIGNDWQI
jgi:sigma-B regulation protein RsbU (phosphoserine phosphatase)